MSHRALKLVTLEYKSPLLHSEDGRAQGSGRPLEEIYISRDRQPVVTGQKRWPHRFIRCGPVECRLGIGEISNVTRRDGSRKTTP